MGKMRISAGRRPAAAVFIAALSVSSCSLFTDVNDLTGARAVGRMWSLPAWSADSRSVFFSDRASSGVTNISFNALDVSSRDRRRLLTVRGLNHGEQVHSTSDPSAFFASVAHADWSLRLNILRVPVDGGRADTIATNVGLIWFAVSSSGNRVAYSGPDHRADSLYVVTVATGELVAMKAAASRAFVVAVSPDGSAVVYDAVGGRYLVAASGGPHQLLWQTPPGYHSQLAQDVLWRGNVPHLLVALADTAGTQPVEILDINGVTGERTLLGTLPNQVPPAYLWALARSSDGQSFAVWAAVAVTHQNIERSMHLYHLYVQTPGDSELRKVSEWEGNSGARWLAFSPDGRSIAVLLQGQLFVVRP